MLDRAASADCRLKSELVNRPHSRGRDEGLFENYASLPVVLSEQPGRFLAKGIRANQHKNIADPFQVWPPSMATHTKTGGQ